jgi:hypothetical protein
MTEWYDLPLELQVSLGAGYAAWLIASEGRRRHARAEDTVFASFAFGAIALVVARALPLLSPWPVASPWTVVVGAGAGIFAAALWRRWLRRAWHWLMARLGVYADDGLPDAWTAIVTQDARPFLTQISVHTTDGRVLYCNEPARYVSAPHRGVYLGSDGSIILPVEEEELPGGKTEVREGVTDPDFGVRLTYVPAQAVVRVNIRVL